MKGCTGSLCIILHEVVPILNPPSLSIFLELVLQNPIGMWLWGVGPSKQCAILAHSVNLVLLEVYLKIMRQAHLLILDLQRTMPLKLLLDGQPKL